MPKIVVGPSWYQHWENHVAFISQNFPDSWLVRWQQELNQSVSSLQHLPQRGKVLESFPGKAVRRVVFLKYYWVIYEWDEANSQIILLTLFDSRQDPQKLLSSIRS